MNVTNISWRMREGEREGGRKEGRKGKRKERENKIGVRNISFAQRYVPIKVQGTTCTVSCRVA